MSNWLKAESSSGLDCGSDQVEKCDLFPYHFLSHFQTCYRKSGLIEVPLLGPIHHQKPSEENGAQMAWMMKRTWVFEYEQRHRQQLMTCWAEYPT